MRYVKYSLLILIILIISSFFVSAISTELFDYSSIDYKFVLSNEFKVIPSSAGSFLDFVSADLSWFPKDDSRQSVDYVNTEPLAKDWSDNNLLFEWHAPDPGLFTISLESKLSSFNRLTHVEKKIKFPISSIDRKYAEFIEPREIIDVNPEIRALASSLASGEDDLYKVLFKLSTWIEKNIKYNLSSLTADASQKSSWVLENKFGVCDELTSLFISLTRSLGIPARFVSGVSYSNIGLTNDNWGPHGWAEVYFPDIGWIPFDVTYKELGFVDATHIKLKTNVDSGGSSISYITKGNNMEIIPGEMDFDVKVINKGFKLNKLLEFDIDLLSSEINFGSYNLITLSVKNPNGYYVAARVSLANVNEIELLDDNTKPLILAPGEETRIYWALRVSPGLREGYVYTFPISITGSRGEKSETSFIASEFGKTYSKDYVLSLIEHEDSGKGSSELLLSCNPLNHKLYLDETMKINCSVTNKGDSKLLKLKVCLEDDCSSAKIIPDATLEFDYEKTFSSLGIHNILFSAENNFVKNNYYLVVDVQDEPLLDIINLDFPETISYDEDSDITFVVKKKSSSNPKNVKIALIHKMMNNEWFADEIKSQYEYKLLFSGSNLDFGDNDFKISIEYDSSEGKHYKVEKEFVMTLEKTNIGQSIMILLNKLELSLRKGLDALISKI